MTGEGEGKEVFRFHSNFRAISKPLGPGNKRSTQEDPIQYTSRFRFFLILSYQCKFCDKCFTKSSNCKQHELTHTGVKPHQCKYCNKCFSQSSNCTMHERTHTGEKFYPCKYCNKCFTYLTSCKRHEHTHTGVKPYQCKFCDKCFTQSSHCKKHELTHTREILSVQLF